jgi:deoxyribose-phosphate aldolase
MSDMEINKEQLDKLVGEITRQAMESLGGLRAGRTDADPGEVLIARMIDHTLLKPDASADQIAALCAEAREYRFASVCVNPFYVALCAELLADVEDVAVGAAIGFPLGANTTEIKVYETLRAIADGATEVDMVINVSAIKNKNWPLVRSDVARVVTAAHAGGILCKVILETGLLTQDEKVMACRICKDVGADFVKTSTGFGAGGATAEDVALMRETVGPDMGVKASGGIRSFADAQRMIAAGATRIGTSAGIRIVQDSQGTQPDNAPTPGY